MAVAGREVGRRTSVGRARFEEIEQYGPVTKGFTVSDKGNFLEFNGKIVYYPNTKITGDVHEIRPINLQIHSDASPITVLAKDSEPYAPKKSQCYEVLVDGKYGFAVKLEGVKSCYPYGMRHFEADNDHNGIYHDRTLAIDGSTVWHWLEPLPAMKKDGYIKTYNGLPQQFHPQKDFNRNKIDNETVVSFNNFQIGKSMADMVQDFERSAEFMATLVTREMEQELISNIAIREVEESIALKKLKRTVSTITNVGCLLGTAAVAGGLLFGANALRNQLNENINAIPQKVIRLVINQIPNIDKAIGE